MSFEEHERYFLWFCDDKDCDRFVAFKPHDFFDCVAELKARGWGFVPPSRAGYDDDWLHYCPKHRKRLANILKKTFKEVG